MTDEIVQISQDPEVQARYEHMRRSGQSHNMAEVLATRAFPGFNGTNKAFNRGRHNGNQFSDCPALGNYYKRIADEQGVSITGKHYMHGLGRYPGDPRAWVADTNDVLRIAEDRNLDLDGIVSRRAHDVPPTPSVPLAEDLWERDAQSLLQINPDMRYEDAREKAFNIRTGNDDGLEAQQISQLVNDYVPHPADMT